MADGRRIGTLAKALLVLGLLITGLALLLQTALADSNTDTPEGAVLTGNYCLECHLGDDPRVESALDWGGGLYRQEYIPCDALRTVREERYFAGSLMLKIAKTSEQYEGDRMGAEALETRLDPQRDSFDKLMQADVDSVATFTGTAKALRFQTAKLLPDAFGLHEETRHRRVILAIVFGTIFLAFLGVLGYERTLKK
jgi:hypothetical protein